MIRKEFSMRRAALSPQQINDWQESMNLRFQSLILPVLNHVLAYYPMPDRNEFDIHPVLDQLRSQFPALRISWPKIDSATHTFEALEVDPNYGFVKNEYSIPEPYNGVVVAPESIDLVFVPLLAVNKQGFRVGYGKGYYDRYLPLCRPNVLKLGFSYFEPVDEISDIHHFDVPLSYCITPTKIYEF